MKPAARAFPVSPVSLLTGGILLFLSLYGAVFCFTSAFSAPVSESHLLILCAVWAGLFLAVFSLPRLRWLALLCVVCAAALAVWRLRGTLYLGEIAVRCAVVNTFAAQFPSIGVIEPIAQLPQSIWTQAATVLVSAAALPLAGLLGLSAVRLRSAWLTLAFTLPFAAVPVAILITPAWPPLAALLCVWCAMALSALAGRWDPAGGARLTLLALPAAAVLLLVLTAALPREDYQRPAWADRANVSLTSWVTRITDRFLFDRSGGALAAADAGVDLSSAGPLRYSGRTVLRVETPLRGRIYLRGFSAGVYQDSQWSPLSDADYELLDWESDPLPLYSSLYRPSLGGFQPMNFPALADRDAFPGHNYVPVSVENTGADPGYVYYPYQLLSTPEQVNGAQFVHDGWLAREEGVWKHTLYVMPECDPLSQAQLSPQARQAEASYRDFAGLHYCDVPAELLSPLSDCLEQMLNHPGHSLPGGADNPHYQALMYGSYTSSNEFRLEIAALIRDYLGKLAVYDPDTPAAPDGEDATLYFLTESRQGYCMHFASAAALLLRLVGIPTRYVAGYVADIPASGKANVPDSNAHAWVEVYLDGYGWEPVEVTPAYAGSRPGQSGTVAQPSPTPGAAITPRPSAGPATPWPTPTPTPAPSPADESSILPPRLLWIPAAALAVLAVLALRRRILLRRRARRWLGSEPDRAVIDAYRYLVRLSRWGGCIPEEVEALAKKAKFSQHPLTAAERDAVLAAAREQAAAVWQSLPWWRRVLFRYGMVFN